MPPLRASTRSSPAEQLGHDVLVQPGARDHALLTPAVLTVT
jgi:hypothetical protein